MCARRLLPGPMLFCAHTCLLGLHPSSVPLRPRLPLLLNVPGYLGIASHTAITAKPQRLTHRLAFHVESVAQTEHKGDKRKKTGGEKKKK